MQRPPVQSSHPIFSLLQQPRGDAMGLRTNSTPAQGSLDFIETSLACYSSWEASWLAGAFNRESLLHRSLFLLLFELSVYIAATRLLRLILKPLHQPAIVCETIVGILLGPSFAGRWGEIGKHLSPPYLTLTGTCAMVGLAFVIFNEALKQDITHVFNSGRKELAIGLSGCIFAYVFTYMTGRIFAGSLTKEEQPHRGNVLTHLPFLLASSSFPVLQNILAEFDLLNSELGRLSMTLSLINSVLSSGFIVVSSSLWRARFGASKGVWHFAAQIALLLFVTVVLRPIFLRLIRKIPAGRKLPSDYVCFSLLVILGISFLGEIIGEMTFGLIVTGLAIPPGPPLASAIVEKTEIFNNVVFLSCFYILNGLHVNVFDIDDWRSFWLLQLVVWAGFLGKFLGTLLPSLYYDMSFQDSLAVAAIMSFKGIMELVYVNIWLRHQLIVDETKMIALELSLLSTTVITCPLLRCLARRVRGPRTLRSWASMQQSMFGGELRVLVCVYDEDNVPSLCQLLSNTLASRSCPLHVVVLRVAELLGRGLPILVSHLKGAARSDGNLHPIFRPFQALERESGGSVSLHPFTSISPLRTAKDDVYKVAYEKQVSLVIIPFSREEFRSRHEVGGAMGRVLARSVLADAPCTVGILANGCRQGRHRSLWASEAELLYRVGLVFLGGPDDREALAYAMRLAKKPNINLLVLRCIGGNRSDEEQEVDDRLVEEFKFRALYRESIIYKEAAVVDVKELVSCIKGMGDDFDLLMVGRQHSSHAEIEAALSSWCESTELGAVGDFLVSPDFAQSSVSVLVLHRKREREWKL